MSDLAPVAIILVTSGTRGERLLFRYPFEEDGSQPTLPLAKPKINPYAQKIAEDRLSTNPSKASAQLIRNGVLVGFEDRTLANILAVKNTLCGSKFMVKIDEVRFVGFPIQMEHKKQLMSSQQPLSSSMKSQSHRINTVNLVFALRANIVDSAIDCYHDLAKELITAICYEERRVGYLSSQSKTIRAVFDHVQSEPEDSGQNPFQMILQRSQLANELKRVHTSLLKTGIVKLHINKWVEVNFILPHKVHFVVTGSRVLHLEPKEIAKFMCDLRPYHGLLLLQSQEEVIRSMPMDSSPSLVKLVKIINPLKSLATLSLDSDISLSQVFLQACHLVLWGKARVIFPLCESNEYLLSSTANTLVNSTMVEDFVQQFPGHSLHVVLSDFSIPVQLGDKRSAHEHPSFQQQRVQMVVWMLQRRLLMQIHRYIFFIPKETSSANSSMTDSSIVQVEEESMFRYFMEGPSNLERVPSMSDVDVASVNSDESIGPSIPIMTPGSSLSNFGKQTMMSKSPSIEVTSDGSAHGGEDGKGPWHTHHSHCLKGLSNTDKNAILQCPGAKTPDDLQLFVRLFQYFDGQHHLEEIMFFENLRRSQLLTLIDKFKDVLVMAAHDAE